jgi:hypothetical protein
VSECTVGTRVGATVGRGGGWSSGPPPAPSAAKMQARRIVGSGPLPRAMRSGTQPPPPQRVARASSPWHITSALFVRRAFSGSPLSAYHHFCLLAEDDVRARPPGGKPAPKRLGAAVCQAHVCVSLRRIDRQPVQSARWQLSGVRRVGARRSEPSGSLRLRAVTRRRHHPSQARRP